MVPKINYSVLSDNGQLTNYYLEYNPESNHWIHSVNHVTYNDIEIKYYLKYGLIQPSNIVETIINY